jgi:rubredoxin
MTNEEILRTPPELLGPVEKQRKMLLIDATLKCECPLCAVPCSKFEAARVAVNDYDFGVTPLAFACPACGAALREVVPFMRLGARSWFWMPVPKAAKSAASDS